MQKRTRAAIKWDDLRYFLAVAKTGSYLAAGRALGVDRTTVSRRVGVLERTMGCALLVPNDHGFHLTATGRSVLAVAARMEEVTGVLAAIRQPTHGGIAGTVRPAVSASLGDAFIEDIVAFRQRHPLVIMEVNQVSDPMIAVSEHRADFGIGVSHEAPHRLNSMLLGTAEIAVYSASNNEPRASDIWVGWSEDIPKAFADWMIEYAPLDAHVSTKVNSWDALKRAVLSGGGVAPLWCMLADREPELVRVFPHAEKHYLALWLTSHRSTERNAAQQAAWMFLAQRIRSKLAGADCLGE